MTHLFIISAVVVAVIWSVITSGLPKKYRARGSSAKRWLSTFPVAPKQQIREFLLIFTGAFDFTKSSRLKFDPRDKILDIYCELHPRQGGLDSSELESLARIIEDKYNCNLSDLWHEELTLGELFTKVSGFEPV